MDHRARIRRFWAGGRRPPPTQGQHRSDSRYSLVLHSWCWVKRTWCEDEGVGAIRMKLASLPLVGRFAVVGAGSAGAAGAVAGLTIGLIVYAPTARRLH